MPTAAPTTINDLSVKPLWSERGSDGISTQGNAKATDKITYIVPWEHRWTFVQEINGIFQGGQANQEIRLPMQAEDAPLLLVSSVSEAKGFGVGDTIPNFRPGISPYVFNPRPFKYARIPVTFSTPDYRTIGDEAFLEIERDIAGQMESLPFGFYELDGIPGTQGIGQFVGCTSWSVTRYRIPTFDDALLRQLRGKVNSVEFLGAAPGTVLFPGASTRSTQDLGGVRMNTARYTFLERDRSWNYGISPLTGEPVPYGPDPIYQEADFNALTT